MPADPDWALRQAAVEAARRLAAIYTDLVPLTALRDGFICGGRRVSFGSFQKGIHRSQMQRGPGALTLTTSFKDPYGDALEPDDGTILYAYRAGALDQADNRALKAACELRAPLVYFKAVSPGQYATFAPMFVTAVNDVARTATLEAGLPVQDTSPEGLVSDIDVRRHATRDVRIRLHQQRFRVDVLRAYHGRCAICALRERSLVQAAHIVPDADPAGVARVVNGIALCAIHHLAYDRNLMGIDPRGQVHVAQRLLDEHDGPMLRVGLQGFHGATIAQPREPQKRPDPQRLEIRFARFKTLAA